MKKKNTFKFTLNITLLKNLILLSMLFLKKFMQLTTNFSAWTAREGPQWQYSDFKIPAQRVTDISMRCSCGKCL